MRKLWVVALANLAVVGLVLTAIIANVVSACSSADGCGSAPPYIYIGLILVLLGGAGLFLLFRKWRAAAVSADAGTDLASDTADIAPKRQRPGKVSRAEQRDADAEEETSSRSRLGRIRSQAAETVAEAPLADGDDFISDDDDVWPASQSMADGGIDWSVDTAEESGVSVDNGVSSSDVATELTAGQGHAGMGHGPIDDDEFGVAWPVDDMPDISPTKNDFGRVSSTPGILAVTLPMMADVIEGGDEQGATGHISLDQIFAGPSAMHGATDSIDLPSESQAFSLPLQLSQSFDACAPAGFPATVADLRALIAVLSLDILLDKQARDDIAAWDAVLAPLDDGDSVGPEDCEAFAQWIDALAERHNADLATTVAHALQQRGGGGPDPIRSAA